MLWIPRSIPPPTRCEDDHEDQNLLGLPLADGCITLIAKAGPNLNAPDETFFIHLHDPRAMANVTISAVHAGTVEISIQLETVEELPLKAQSVSVTLGNPEQGGA